MIDLYEALAGLRDGTLSIEEYRILRGLVVITDEEIIASACSGAPAELGDPLEPTSADGTRVPSVDDLPAPVGWWRRLPWRGR